MANASGSQHDASMPHTRSEQNFIPVGQHVDYTGLEVSGELDQKMVEEIESLCMNCHEDVRFLFASLYTPMSSLTFKIRVSPVSF